MPTEKECEAIRRRFLNDPMLVYKGVFALLTGERAQALHIKGIGQAADIQNKISLGRQPMLKAKGHTGDKEALPLLRAVEAIQLPKPKGAKRGAMAVPMMARMLSELSATRLKRMSKLWRSQMTIVATKMTVKALRRKSFAFSHI